MEDMTYCNSLLKYSRLKTSEVAIGDVCLGASNPIRLQSMTNTNSMDTEATIEQCVKIIQQGADYVRITAPGIKEAENLKYIKEGLLKKGYNTPIIADIHFNPKAADIAAHHIEKVRINPGNYVDKKRFDKIEYTDSEYEAEINKIRERFIPLIQICKQQGTAMRIGTNHGSLSDRILSRYGDTPLGMAESTMEFLRICVDENFKDVVISLKASNTRIMVYAYRLIVSKMKSENMNFPLHLGVTEAGSGMYGRIKSAVGIGALLADGIGDTVRVSLTEAPEKELPVAKEIVDYFNDREEVDTIKNPIEGVDYSPFAYKKRESVYNSCADIGGDARVVVVASVHHESSSGQVHNPQTDFLFDSDSENQIIAYSKTAKRENDNFHLFDAADVFNNTIAENSFIQFSNATLTDDFLSKVGALKDVVLVFYSDTLNKTAEVRNAFFYLAKHNLKHPVLLKYAYDEVDITTLSIKAAADFGAVLLDGFGDGIWIENKRPIDGLSLSNLAFDILQSSRVRTTKTEYISCPSCGRTLFDLESVTQKIHEKTAHLSGLKIGIMGCIVNGPGEMADADYGYVGAGIGVVNLYKGQTVVKRKIKSSEAVDELIHLIKEHGDWIDA